MSIDVSKAGLPKPVQQTTAILWYRDFEAPESTHTPADLYETIGSLEMSALSGEEYGFKSAGEITTEGIRTASASSSSGSSSSDTIFRGWSELEIERKAELGGSGGGSSDSPQITFGLLEVLNDDVMPLIFSEVEPGVQKGLTRKPNPKSFIVEYKVKNKTIREFYPYATFASRNEHAVTRDGLDYWEVTYNINELDGRAGYDYKRTVM